MRVLLLANHFNTGGISSYILTLSKGLLSRGHSVVALSSGGELVQEFESTGGKHLCFGFRVKSDADPRIYLTLPRIKELSAMKIDIVHSNTRATQILGERYAKTWGLKHLSTCHGFFKNRFARRVFPCWGKRVIAISRPVKDHLINDFHVDPAKVKLIPNGISLDQFKIVTDDLKKSSRSRYQITGDPVIGIIARLSDVKGHSYLIKAFKLILEKFPRAKLVIVGEGPEESKLRQLVDELNLNDAVLFLNIVNRTAEILPALDVFVMPSLQEGLGLAVMEAQAVGIPVVASKVGGLPDLIQNNQTGILVEPKNIEALFEGIAFVLNEPQRARRMGIAGRESIEKSFSSDQMVEETINLYQETLKS